MKISPLTKLLLWILGPTLLAANPAARAAEGTLVGDTFNLSTPQGATTTLTVQASTTKRAYFQFTIKEGNAPLALATPHTQMEDGPLEYEITGDQITKATLRIYVSGIASGPVELVAKAITSSWDEATLKTTLLPTIGSALYDAVKVVTLDKFVTFDVTTLVKGWIDGTIPNYGVAVESVNGQAGAFPGLNAAGSVTISAKEQNSNVIPAALTIQVGPAVVPKRGDVSMGSYTAGRQP